MVIIMAGGKVALSLILHNISSWLASTSFDDLSFARVCLLYPFAELNFKLVMARTGVNLAKGLLTLCDLLIFHRQSKL